MEEEAKDTSTVAAMEDETARESSAQVEDHLEKNDPASVNAIESLAAGNIGDDDSGKAKASKEEVSATIAASPGPAPKGPRKKVRRTIEQKLDALRAFKERHGHVNVPKWYQEDLQLGTFVCDVRNNRRFKLTPEHRQQLMDMGFDFENQKEKFDRKFDERLKELEVFKAEKGHMKVPNQNVGLGRWVAKMRENYARGQLKQDRIDRLNAIGFVWKRKEGKPKDDPEKEDPKWLANYQRLADFQKEHGHCHFPPAEDKYFNMWVLRQRYEYNATGRLPGKRKELLDKIGFEWKVDQSKRACALNQNEWDVMFEQLIEFHRVHGHAWVHSSHENKQLAFFVTGNLQAGRNGMLVEERAKKLQALGLYWGRDDDVGWNQYYDRLKAHRDIEQRLGKSRQLEGPDMADWMGRQLRLYKRSSLAEDRKKKLEEIDFFTNTPPEAKTRILRPGGAASKKKKDGDEKKKAGNRKLPTRKAEKRTAKRGKKQNDNSREEEANKSKPGVVQQKTAAANNGRSKRKRKADASDTEPEQGGDKNKKQCIESPNKRSPTAKSEMPENDKEQPSKKKTHPSTAQPSKKKTHPSTAQPKRKEAVAKLPEKDSGDATDGDGLQKKKTRTRRARLDSKPSAAKRQPDGESEGVSETVRTSPRKRSASRADAIGSPEDTGTIAKTLLDLQTSPSKRKSAASKSSGARKSAALAKSETVRI